MAKVLFGLVFLFGWSAAATSLGDLAKTPAFEAKLDILTKTRETPNRVILLHLGQAARPARLKMIDEARHYIFMNAIYWEDDDEGLLMADTLRRKKRSLKDFDLRLILDWTTTYLHEKKKREKHSDFLSYSLNDITGGNTREWNPPRWGLRFSLNLIKARAHEKILLADGTRLMIGDINIGNEYLLGGEDHRGWHCDDTLIEGPAAQEAAKTFIEKWELINWLDEGKPFPVNLKPEIQALQNIFYEGNGFFPFTMWVDNARYTPLVVDLPLKKSFDDPKYFPAIPPSSDAKALVRVIYDNPLVDKNVATGKPESKIMDAIKYLLKHTQRSAKFFMPYPTLSAATVDALVEAARRGVAVSIITNSYETNDVGKLAYVAGASHYRKLIDSGVRIFEWLGEDEGLLESVQQGRCHLADGCWPGHTIHTKAAIFDDSIVVTGSHNMNVRSEFYNSESSVIINDREYARQFSEVFDKDLGANGHPFFECQGLRIPPPVKEITPQILQLYEKKYSLERDYSFFEKFL